MANETSKDAYDRAEEDCHFWPILVLSVLLSVLALSIAITGLVSDRVSSSVSFILESQLIWFTRTCHDSKYGI